VIEIAYSWATINREFGIESENAPLEAGWFLSSVLKGLELLKYTWPGYDTYKVGSSDALPISLIGSSDACSSVVTYRYNKGGWGPGVRVLEGGSAIQSPIQSGGPEPANYNHCTCPLLELYCLIKCGLL
jgi:hypothetical protein